MNKILIAAGFIFLLHACNDNTQQHTEHAGMDSSAHSTHTTKSESNEMAQLMAAMMNNMHGQKPTGNNDLDYANMMLQHHQGAVDMANLQVIKGKDTALKSFSRKVIADQQKEIRLMGEFISRNKSIPSPDNKAFQDAMNASMEKMMSAAVKTYDDIDKDFVAQMIPHHQSAVDMAKAYLQYGKDEVLVNLSNDIVRSQSMEIEWLKGLEIRN